MPSNEKTRISKDAASMLNKRELQESLIEYSLRKTQHPSYLFFFTGLNKQLISITINIS